MSKDLKAQEGGVMGDLYGCSDHNCIFGHQGGMGTNGGCSCEKTLQRDGHQKAARQIRLLRSEVTRLRAEKAALVEALEMMLEMSWSNGFGKAAAERVAIKALAAAQEGE